MNSLCRRILLTNLIHSPFKYGIVKKSLNCTFPRVRETFTFQTSPPSNFHQIRYKSKSNVDNNEENYDDDATLNKDSKVVKFNSGSMRTDLILKSALGVARNKIEQQFYESRIRINGRKVLKKSASVKIGDEIDIIKMVSPKNPDHLYVSRVEILNATANEDSISLTARRFKNLLIENYEKDPYKGNADSV